jgi:hypothetical protein
MQPIVRTASARISGLGSCLLKYSIVLTQQVNNEHVMSQALATFMCGIEFLEASELFVAI